MITLDKWADNDLMNRRVRSRVTGRLGRVTAVVFDNIHLKSCVDDKIHPVVVTVTWDHQKRSVGCHRDFTHVEVVDEAPPA